MIPIGNSGFGYTTRNNSSKRQRGLDCTITNLKTKETLVMLRGKGVFSSRSGRSDHPASPASKTFLGFDERYYHVHVTGTNVQWGQVQSDGAVLKSDRSILKHIDFYPLYIKKAPVMVPGEPVKPAVEPQITTIAPKPEIKTEVSKLSWIQKIINWIIKILNR